MTPLEEILTQQLADLKRRYEALEVEHAKLSGKDLTEEQRCALAFIDSAVAPNQYVYAETVAEALKIEIARANWLLSGLAQSKHLFEMPSSPPRYRIEQKGRNAVHGSSV